MKKILSEIGHSELFKAADLFAVPHFKTVYDLYQEYVAAGNYPYISAVKDYIVKKLGLELTAEESRNLESFVFYAARQTDEHRKIEYGKKMLADGWQKITSKAIMDAKAAGKKLLVTYQGETILGAVKDVEETLKPYVLPDGHCFLMRPRARNKGFSVELMSNAFYKVL